MRKVLILTVGGSCEPLVNAILNRRPDYVIFVCSRGSTRVVNGDGEPCRPPRNNDLPKDKKWLSIVTQTGLIEENYTIITLTDPDNLSSSYQEITERINKILQEKFPGEQLNIVANYTGGTKTMSVALALAALNREDWDLELNRGPRVDLVKIQSGDVPVLVNKWDVFASHQLKIIQILWENFHYAEAMELAQEMLKKPLSPEKQLLFQTIYNLSEAFDLWDRFEHEEAYRHLQPYAKYFKNYMKILAFLKENKGYIKVKDLLMNAKRRAKQKRFDDAVARLYRAVEMIAQIRLKEKFDLDTGNISVDSLPEQIKERYRTFADERGKVQLGLSKAYELLKVLNDPLGELYFNQEKKIKNALKRRNYSILAHGNDPITLDIYSDVEKILEGFLDEGFRCVKDQTQIEQLPTQIPDIKNSM